MPTFQQCAERYIDEHWSTWSEKHRDQWPSSLKRYAYPTIGSLTIAEIRPSHIQDLLEPIWVSKRETANRVRGRIETIIAKNVDINDRDFRNPAKLTKQLREKLPKRPKRVALPDADAGTFMSELGLAEGRAAVALRFLIFTVCRTNEIVGAKWIEIDRTFATGPVWRIPGERMKMDQDHVVPLTKPALDILDGLSKGQQSELIFTNPDGQEFSENAMLAVLDRMGYPCARPEQPAFRRPRGGMRAWPDARRAGWVKISIEPPTACLGIDRPEKPSVPFQFLFSQNRRRKQETRNGPIQS